MTPPTTQATALKTNLAAMPSLRCLRAIVDKTTALDTHYLGSVTAP